jgi:MADS-box transcription factor
MADITDQHDQTSPTDLDDAHSVGNGNANNENRGVKRQRPAADDDDDDDEKGGRERRKIEIKFINDKSRRHITFSKRKAGIMKKVREGASVFDTSRRFVFFPPPRPPKKTQLFFSSTGCFVLVDARARTRTMMEESLSILSFRLIRISAQ